MRTELFSLRSSKEEITYISDNKLTLARKLDELCSIRLLFKTEIDSNPKKLKNEFLGSFNSDNPPEFYIFANATDTTDSSSLRRLFTSLIKLAERELAAEFEEDAEKGQELHLLITPIADIGEEYPAYCFKIHTKKLLVLPRQKFIKQNYIEYIAKAVNRAKEIFLKKQAEAPYGYIITESKVRLSGDTAPIPLIQEDESFAEATPSKVKEDSPATSHKSKPETAQTQKASDSEYVNISPASEVNEDIDISRIEAPEAENTPSDAEPPARDAEEENAESIQTEITEETSAKGGKFKKFIRSFIPCKGDSVKNIILKIVVLVAIVAFLAGAYLLIDFYFISPAINKSVMNEIQNIAYGTNTITTDANGNVISTEKGNINWDALKEVNDEIVGWIRVNNSEIDYPVLYHEGDSADSQYYIYLDYNKKPADFGSIFVDYRCPEVLQSRHVILHGHNMGVDKSMFGSLTNYPSNVDYYKSAPIVELDTPESQGEWLIFSVMKIDVSNNKDDIFNYLMTEFDSDAQYMNFIYNLKERSYLDIDIPINETDRILTLSTCSYESDNMRTIVVARQLREGENPQSYIDSAKKHSPASTVSSTFRTELEAGNITWYDGNSKLEGDEEILPMIQSEMYTVKFLNAKDKVISTQYILKGKDAKPPKENPRKAAADGYYYTFKGWDTSYKNVTKDLVIKPVFTQHKLNIVTEPPTTVPTEPDVEIVTPPEAPVTPVTPAPEEPAATEAPATEAPTEEPPTTQQDTETSTQAP